MKRLIALLTALCICLTFSGCARKEAATDQTSGGAAGSGGAPASEIKLVRKTDKTKYILSNGIEINHQDATIDTPKGTVKVYGLPQISGLVDKTLEARINRSIENDVSEGVKKIAGEINTNFSEPLYCSVQFNANNLLSVSVMELYSTPRLGFLYRLTDGQRLYLKDIFTEGTEYVPLLNQKVIEGLLGGERSEEEVLREPFTTIGPDQGFCYSQDTLYIIFRAGEAGFARIDSVGVPMSQIDDYVDVADRYSGTERKTHEKGSLIIRRNNIFAAEKGDTVKKGKGAVWTHYPGISGLRDSGFEELINNDIRGGISEVLGGGAFDNLPEPPREFRGCNAVIEMSVLFNHYGVLTIQRRVNNYENFKEMEEYGRLYSYDLINKKRVDPKTYLTGYIGHHPAAAAVFTGLVKDELKKGSRDPNTAGAIDYLDYPGIVNTGAVCFEKYYLEETNILVSFDRGTLGGNTARLTARVPLKAILEETPEEFFAH